MYSYSIKPDVPQKLTELAESARYDVCLATCSTGKSGQRGRTRDPQNPLTDWIYPASVPGQGTVFILKVLQSNQCRNKCTYCKFAAGNGSLRRVTMSPEELSASFIQMYRARLVDGLFVSSGVSCSPDSSMQNLVKTAEILRFKYKFRGYLHLKVIPGCSENLIESAARYADRLSINLEAPEAGYLHQIAPDKDLYKDILPAAESVAGLLQKKAEGGGQSYIRAKSQTTQFVVGAADEKDLDIMNTVDYLYRDFHMFRAYFSAYQQRGGYETPAASGRLPAGIGSIMKTEGEEFRGSPLLREHRLYQCDFLLRAYGFRLPDLVFDETGNIPLETDPKTAYAVMNQSLFPVDINKASMEELLRVPGIGPQSAERIVSTRSNDKFRSLDELKATGAWTRRAASWIEIDGRRPDIPDRKNTDHEFDADQGWLFEELAPDNWKTSMERKDLDYKSRKDPAKAEESIYEYPGQKGKWVNYQMKKKDPRIMCR